MDNIERTPITYDMLPETGNPRYTKKSIKECKRCGCLFIPRSPTSQFCDDCRKPHELERARERAKGYVNSGRRAELRARAKKIINVKVVHIKIPRNQAGENNGNYKNGTGIDWYKRALQILPERCNRCGLTENELQSIRPSKVRILLLHHKDGNHENNSPDNWEILCKKCHQKHHSCRDKLTGRFVSKKV